MKIGDIIINPWVSKEYDGKLNPMYATIYIGNNRSVDYKGRVHRWAEKVYKEGNKREWKVAGHCNLYEWVHEQIIKAIEPPKEGDEGMTELKPCPFCGSKDAPKMVKQYGRDTCYVLCDYQDGGCGATGGMRHYRDEAVECWNTRAGDSE